MNISLSLFAPENLVPRDGFAVPSCVSLLISILTLNLVLLLTRFLPISAAASIYLLKPPYAIGSVPSLSGHHPIAYRWRSTVHCRRESDSKGPVNLKVVRNGAALAAHHGPIYIRLSFPHPRYNIGNEVGHVESVCYKDCLPSGNW